MVATIAIRRRRARSIVIESPACSITAASQMTASRAAIGVAPNCSIFAASSNAPQFDDERAPQAIRAAGPVVVCRRRSAARASLSAAISCRAPDHRRQSAPLPPPLCGAASSARLVVRPDSLRSPALAYVARRRRNGSHIAPTAQRSRRRKRRATARHRGRWSGMQSAKRRGADSHAIPTRRGCGRGRTSAVPPEACAGA